MVVVAVVVVAAAAAVVVVVVGVVVVLVVVAPPPPFLPALSSSPRASSFSCPLSTNTHVSSSSLFAARASSNSCTNARL